MTDDAVEWGQVPVECTLPTAEQPLRVAEFNDVFALVRAVQRPAPARLLLALRPAPGRAQAVRDLAARESTCCSFFDFTVHDQDDEVVLEVTVPPAQLGVLEAMAEHAQQVARAVGPT